MRHGPACGPRAYGVSPPNPRSCSHSTMSTQKRKRPRFPRKAAVSWRLGEASLTRSLDDRVVHDVEALRLAARPTQRVVPERGGLVGERRVHRLALRVALGATVVGETRAVPLAGVRDPLVVEH